MRITMVTCQIKRVTRGRRERFLMSFLENWKKMSEFWENMPWLWPSKFFYVEKPEIFSCRVFRSCFVHEILTKVR